MTVAVDASEIAVEVGAQPLTLRGWRWASDDVEESQPSLLILHGFLDQSEAWRDVGSTLAGRLGRAVVCLDHRGHGLSDHVGAGGFYHFWDYVGDLDAVVRALSPDRPVDLLAHSMGGTLATLYAAVRPERVARLVLIEGLGPPDMRSRALAHGRQFLDHLETPRVHRPLADLAEGVQRMRRINPRLPEATAERLVRRSTRPLSADAPAGPLTWTWDPLHRARAPRPFDHSLHLDYLAAIEAPVLSLFGADSPMADAIDLDGRLAALRDVTHRVVPGWHHNPHLEAPDELVEHLAPFLEAPWSPT